MTSRLALAFVAALSSAMVSIDPAMIAGAHARLPLRPTRPAIAAEAPRSSLPSSNDAPGARAPSAPAPRDVEVELTRDGTGHRVVVRRPGHLVAIEYGSVRGAGKDWAAVHVELPGASTRGDLVWETTPLGALTAERGLVSLHREGQDLKADLSLSAPPLPALSARGKHHTCAAHRDPTGGFTVLCRLHHGARRVSAANVTSPRVEDDTWVIPEKEPLVRLDLPLARGRAEARVIGFVHGLTGTVLRAEASFAEGEEPTLIIEETERNQPAASDFN